MRLCLVKVFKFFSFEWAHQRRRGSCDSCDRPNFNQRRIPKKDHTESKDSLPIHPGKLTWIPKMMVWKRWFLLNMAIFGIYVKFPGCISQKVRITISCPTPPKNGLSFHHKSSLPLKKNQVTKWWMIPSRELTYLLPKVLLSRWCSFYPRWDMWSFPGG